MGDSERYIPPPPPYELSIQHDQKVSETQAHPFREEGKDSKQFRTLSDKIQSGVLPSNSKHLARSVSGNLRAPRPLPPSPADARSRTLGTKFGSVADIKSFAAQNDLATDPHPPVPSPFSATGPLDEAPYMQSMRHSSPSIHSPSFHYPSPPLHDAHRRSFDDRWRGSTYSPMESSVETSKRRPSYMSSQSPSYPLPQSKDMRLTFDPSVAYSASQANAHTAFVPQRGVAASLYR